MIPQIVVTSAVAVGYWFGITWVNARGYLDPKGNALPLCPRCDEFCMVKDIYDDHLTIRCDHCKEVFVIGNK